MTIKPTIAAGNIFSAFCRQVLLCSPANAVPLLRRIGRLAATVILLAAVGCAVPQPRGEGQERRVIEPTTKRGYWLYLPKEYVETDAGQRARLWPLVITFHGMKPFDSAYPQIREWQQEADRYGFVVIAPELRAPAVFKQFPVRTVGRSFKSDEEATLAILDHVFATTRADPGNVLTTSWSSGGYLAHYMLNRYPDRFTCLAVRQSNFSQTILDPQQVERSRFHPLLILTTQNDFGGVKRECRQAIQWYEQHQYSNFAWLEIKGLGHARTPDTAAAFFARLAGVEPNQPPIVLIRRQAIAGNARGLALLANGAGGQPTSAAKPTRRPPQQHASVSPTRPPAGTTHARTSSPNASTAHQPDAVTAAARREQSQPLPRPRPPRSPTSIRVSSAIGTEPLVLAFAADCPADWHNTADFLWTLNGDPICSGVNGQKTITEPGEHTLGLLVVTHSGREHRAYRLIRVLPHIGSSRRPDSDTDM